MKIAFISTLDGFWGGSEELWYRTAQLALQNGHDVSLLAYDQLAANQKITSVFKKKTVFKIKSDLQIKKSGFFPRLINFLRKRTNPAYKTIHFLTKYQPDIIVVSQTNTYEAIQNDDFYQLLKQSQGLLFLISQFNLEYTILSDIDRIKIKEIFKLAEKVVFVSIRNKEVAQRQLATKIDNALIIDNPVNLIRPEYISYPVDEIPTFASVARFDVQFKGQDLLLQVLGQDKWKQRIWSLNLYGEGKDKKYIKDLIIFYRLQDRVFLKGHVDDIKAIWERNQVLVLPSIAEGKPLALEEAMICGRPAIVTDVGGNSELIIDNITGFVAKAPTLELIDEAFERAWENKENWERAGRKAHDWIMENIDLKPEETLISFLLG